MPSLLLVLLCANALGQTATDTAIQVSASVQKTPPAITLGWPPTSSTSFTIYRKALTDSSWGAPVASLAGGATGWTDTAVVAGIAYDYKVVGAGSVTAYGFVASGIEIPLVESRGAVVLVVDSTWAASLVSELARLETDLAGDGWTVLRHDVARSDSVASVKSRIVSEYSRDPSNVKAVFLFGHVPVPYSGATMADDHPDHYGAWPADLFYGDMDGVWTDAQNYDTTVAGRQHNVAGDGKYDPSYAPSAIELQVGRVDLSDMPAFAPATEGDLLRRYLEKDHNFRYGLITAERRGLIDDNFGYYGGEAFATSGWRSLSALFGASNVQALDWFSTLNTDSYLWAYGCGGGRYDRAFGVGSTSDFAATDTRAIFTMLFGSYFGDWDTTNNFLRAPLATATYGLTSAWSGRPLWVFHHMGLGETVGYAARASQNGDYYTAGWAPGVWTNLMGDPTLRMHIVAPPSAPTVTPSRGAAIVRWSESPEPVLGYHVYRSNTARGPFTRVNPVLLTTPSFLDTEVAGAAPQKYTWAVRAVKLETSASGTYFNASQAVFVSGFGGGAPMSFYTVFPCRLLDTRKVPGPDGGPALAAGEERVFVLSGKCGIPADASVVALNIAVAVPTASGNLTVYPTGTARPATSSISYPGGQARSNNGTVELGAGGDVTVSSSQTSGSVHVVLDVSGYYR